MPVSTADGSTLRHADPALAAFYRAAGYWGEDTVGSLIAQHARTKPEAAAYICGSDTVTWREYDAMADHFARVIVAAGIEVGARVAIYLPDGAMLHAAFVGCERAGVVAVGIGTRAGDAEIAHLLSKTTASVLLCATQPAERAAARVITSMQSHGVGVDLAIEIDGAGTAKVTRWTRGSANEVETDEASADLSGRSLGPDDVFLLNSTSGTTGLPKCVAQFQNRWLYFHQLAANAGELTSDDVIMSLIPGPFGFGLWTAHVTPTALGAPCVLQPRFNVDDAIRLIEKHRVTVLTCVSTQFVMMLNSPELDRTDLSSLRCMFTGGENVPFEKARDWEHRTGSLVLQFFGSNESGAFSHTSTTDTVEQRLLTAGKVIPEMQVRLYDDNGVDITATGGPGQPGGLGPALCAGYWGDDAANDELFRSDGWLLMGDLITIDATGYVRVVGRKSDFIIRGGKNISAATVESALTTHAAIDLAAAIPVPDEIFGEKVCAVVSLRPHQTAPTLEELTGHLAAVGIGKESFPEYLVVLDSLPTSSGGKVAKGELKKTVAELLERRSS